MLLRGLVLALVVAATSGLGLRSFLVRSRARAWKTQQGPRYATNVLEAPPTRVAALDYNINNNTRVSSNGVKKKEAAALRDLARAVKVEKRASDRVKWARLGALISRDGPLLVFSSVCLVFAAVSEVGVPHFSSRALNAIVFNAAAVKSGGAATRSVARELWGLAAASTAAASFAGLRGGTFWIAGVRVVSRLRRRMFENLLAQDLGYFDTTSTGEMTSRLASDATKVADVVSFNLNILARQTIQALGGLGYLFWLDAPLAAIALVWMGVASGMTDVYGRFARKTARKAQDSLAEAAATATEALTNVRVVRACGAENSERDKYAARVAKTTVLQTRHGVAYGISRVAIGGARACSSIALLAVGAHRVMRGHVDAERLVTFIFYSAFVNNAAFDVGEQWAKVEEALGAGAAAFEVAHRVPTWRGKHPPSTMKTTKDDDDDNSSTNRSRSPRSLDTTPQDKKRGGRVLFEDVVFDYPARVGERVLRGVSVTVEPGEKVALVGQSGSGKSTLTKLLLRHYEPTRGSVTLDGVEVHDLEHADLASRVAYVEQEPRLFSGTLADNIRFGLDPADPRASAESVKRAASRAGVLDFARFLPLGLDTPVGEGGAFQSGGQKQRVAIARALVRDPEVIVLDEPSSALDARTEELVQQALDETPCSMLVVAHRLATIQEADRIYVLQNGTVLETGTHADLMRHKGGLYAAMVEKQSFADRSPPAPPPPPPPLPPPPPSKSPGAPDHRGPPPSRE